jgi:hypothetical protein
MEHRSARGQLGKILVMSACLWFAAWGLYLVAKAATS